MNTTLAIFDIAIILLNVVWWIIIVQFILSLLFVFNVVNLSSPFVRSLHIALERLTAPLYRPIRRILPDFGGIDFSPMVVLLLIMVLQKLLAGAALDIARRRYDRTDHRRQSRRRGASRHGSATRSRSFAPRPAARPALPWCWSARIRRARSMSGPRARRRAKPGWRASSIACPPPRPRTNCWRWSTRLNADPAVDGILVQLPLPPQIDERCRSSRGSTPTRMSTASTRSMPVGWRSGSTASCPARRWAA